MVEEYYEMCQNSDDVQLSKYIEEMESQLITNMDELKDNQSSINGEVAKRLCSALVDVSHCGIDDDDIKSK